MKLNLASLAQPAQWTGYHLPQFDIAQVAQNTKARPTWLHFGAGNIFRMFPAVLCQRLLEKGSADTGIICCESYDDEVITKCFRPYDNLSLAVTLLPDGAIEKEIVGSVTESLTVQHDFSRIREIFEAPSLQMVSFTITEKGYAVNQMVENDMQGAPADSRSLMAQLAALCIARFHACGKPLALVSMDNCSHNGEKLSGAVLGVAKAWHKSGKITDAELDFLRTKITFPWSMIDKITPRPDPKVEASLQADGLQDISPFITAKNTYTAAFVNAEKPQYLVVEDDFPNGRPELEQVGVYMTARDTVNATERMKVTGCLNPLHTAMSVYGCLLGYTLISAEMQDADIVSLITQLGYHEALPVVTDPKILNPKAFIDEVMGERFPNPFMPDAPQRIATDTSQKVGIRFGETIKAYQENGQGTAGLVAIPLAIAGWLRYLLAVDDQGAPMEVSADPMKAELQAALSTIVWDDSNSYTGQIRTILKNAAIFGTDLEQAGLADKIETMFISQLGGAGSVRKTLQVYLASQSQSK